MIKEWLRNVIQALYKATAIHPACKLAAAVVLMCCAHRVCRFYIPDDISIVLLKMLPLQPSGEGFEFLESIMIEKESR